MEIGPIESLNMEFVATLRTHRSELLRFFIAGRHVPILAHLARQILAHEFDSIDEQTREAFIENLRLTNHPACREAITFLGAAADTSK